MNRKRSIGAAIGLTVLLITSAAAQTPTGQGDGAAPAVTFAVTVAKGSLLKVQNNWRGRALIGTRFSATTDSASPPSTTY